MRRAQSVLRRCAASFSEPVATTWRSVTTSADTTNYEAEVLKAWPRHVTGHKLKGLRKQGQTPGILFSLPDNSSQLVALDSKEITHTVKQYGRSGLVSRRFILRVLGAGEEATDYPVLPRQVHRNAVTDVVENVTFVHCPPERRILVNVPVRVRRASAACMCSQCGKSPRVLTMRLCAMLATPLLLGAETCPGVKRGGYLNLIRRKIRCSCPGDTVPAYVEVDVSAMELNQRVLLSDIAFPDGVQVSVTARPLAAARAQAARPCAAPGG